MKRGITDCSLFLGVVVLAAEIQLPKAFNISLAARKKKIAFWKTKQEKRNLKEQGYNLRLIYITVFYIQFQFINVPLRKYQI